MDLCSGVLVLGILFGIVTVVGHGLWVVAAAILRAIAGMVRPALQTCPDCGREIRGPFPLCPRCAERHRAPADPFEPLTTTTRVLRDLADRGKIDQYMAEAVYRRLDEAREEMRADFDEPTVALDSLSLVARIERVLTSRLTLEALSPRDVERLCRWFERLDDETAPFSSALLWKSAQFFKWQHQPRAALRYYRRLFRDHASEPFIKAAALEAARYAQHQHRGDDARAFLEVAARCELSPQEAKHLAGLREELEASADVVFENAPSQTAAPPLNLGNASDLSTTLAAMDAVSAGAKTRPTEPPHIAAVPRRSFQEMLAGFMEERNILWGELAGGLLIVGCSIALVVSLWTTLEAIPYFPFLVFAGLTGILFGAGVYTLRHWKLEATSRGLLVIANLFVPLDFLVMAGLAKNAPWGLIDGILAAVAVVAFSWLVWKSGRILLPSLSPLPRYSGGEGPGVRGLEPAATSVPVEGDSTTAPQPSPPGTLGGETIAVDLQSPSVAAPQQKLISLAAGLLTLATVGAGASQLVVARWLDSAEPQLAWFLLLTLLPAVFHGIASLGVTWHMGRRATLDGSAVNQYLLFLGQAAFAALIALGFIVYASDQPMDAFRHLAVALAVAALPLVIGGAMLRDRLASMANDDPCHGLSAGHARVLGTILSLAGTMLAIFALLLGWPRPLALLAIGSANAAAFCVIARVFRLPYAHIPCLVNFVVAFVSAFHGLRGAWPAEADPAAAAVVDLVFAPATAFALTMLAVGLALASELLARIESRSEAGPRQKPAFLEATIYLIAAAQTAAAAVALGLRPDDAVAGRGFGILAVLGLTTLAVNVRWKRPELSALGALAAAVSFYYGAAWYRPNAPVKDHWLWALAAHTTLFLGGAAVLKRRLAAAPESPWHKGFYLPLHDAGLLSSVGAVVALVVFASSQTVGTCTGVAGWLMAVWFSLALAAASPRWLLAVQGISIVAVYFGTAFWLTHQVWVPDGDPFHPDVGIWQAHLLSQAGLALSWVAARILTSPNRLMSTLWGAWQAPIDFVLTAVLVIAHGLLLLESLMGPVAREIAFAWLGLGRIAGVPALPMTLDWAWTTWALTLATLLLGLRQHARAVPRAVVGRVSDPSEASAAAGAAADGSETRPTKSSALLPFRDFIDYPLLIFAGLSSAVLLAHYGIESNAAASALRWSLAVVGLFCSAVVWGRERLLPLAARCGISPPPERGVAAICGSMLLAGAVAPVLILTTRVAILGFQGLQPADPVAESFFAQIGWVPSMTAPLAIVALTLMGYGIRDNRAGYIFSTGLVLLYAIAGGFALAQILDGIPFDGRLEVLTLQLGVAVLAGWMLLWLASGRWQTRAYFGIQGTLAVLGNVLLLSGVIGLVDALFAGDRSAWQQIGRWPGWIACLLTIAACLWALARFRPASRVHGLAIAGLALVRLVDWTELPLAPTEQFPYHLAMAALVNQMALMTLLGWPADRTSREITLSQDWRGWLPARPTQAWARALGVIAILATLTGLWDDPLKPYFGAMILLAVAALWGVLALWTGRQGDVYRSGLIAPVIAYVVCQAWIAQRLQIQNPIVTDFEGLGWLWPSKRRPWRRRHWLGRRSSALLARCGRRWHFRKGHCHSRMPPPIWRSRSGSLGSLFLSLPWKAKFRFVPT
jgi:hypothetical protein